MSFICGEKIKYYINEIKDGHNEVKKKKDSYDAIFSQK